MVKLHYVYVQIFNAFDKSTLFKRHSTSPAPEGGLRASPSGAVQAVVLPDSSIFVGMTTFLLKFL